MLDQIEKFLKNKYTIFSLIGVVILIIALNVYSYFKTEKNEAEFLRFVEINDAFASDIESAKLSNELNLDFENFGYELISKSVLAKKALEEDNFELAFSFYGELYSSLKDSGIDSGTKQVLQEQFLENILRLTMQLELYESGTEYIENSNLNSVRFFELAGDFYKYYENYEIANEWYGKAIDSDITDAQKNLIRLKLSN